MAPATDDATSQDGDASGTRSVLEMHVGQLVAGTYRIVSHIGSGGSGHVFAAEHVRLGKLFALKLLRNDRDSGRRAAQRFRREAKAIARLSSEHVVSVVDCGELEDHTPYLVMELLAGEDLRSLLNREGPLPMRRAVQIAIEACRGLAAVHEAGLVHRDLKPENLFIARRSGGEDWCKVLDFGVAKMDASLSTTRGAIIGTVRYMAPEQLSDAESVGPATDVYALGAVLFECLTGSPLVDGSAVQEVMYCIMNVEPRPLRDLVPTLPGAVADIVERCVAKPVDERPASAAELARLLSAAVAAPRLLQPSLETRREDELPKPRVKGPAGKRAYLVVAGVLTAALGAAWGGSLRTTASIPSAQGRAPPRQFTAPTPAAPATAQPAAPGQPTAAAVAPPAPVGTFSAALRSTRKPGSPAAEGPARPKPELASPRSPSEPRGPAGRFDSTNPYAE